MLCTKSQKMNQFPATAHVNDVVKLIQLNKTQLQKRHRLQPTPLQIPKPPLHKTKKHNPNQPHKPVISTNSTVLFRQKKKPKINFTFTFISRPSLTKNHFPPPPTKRRRQHPKTTSSATKIALSSHYTHKIPKIPLHKTQNPPQNPP